MYEAGEGGAYSERAWETDYSMYQQQLALCNSTTSKAGGRAPLGPPGTPTRDPRKRPRNRGRSIDRDKKGKRSRSTDHDKKRKRSRSKSPKPAAKLKITEVKKKFGDKLVKCLNARPMGKGVFTEYCMQFYGQDGCKAKSCKRRHRCDIIIKMDGKDRARSCDEDHKRCDHTGPVIEA